MLKKIVIIMSVIFCMSLGTVFAGECPLEYWGSSNYYNAPLDKDNWVAYSFNVDNWLRVRTIDLNIDCDLEGYVTIIIYGSGGQHISEYKDYVTYSDKKIHLSLNEGLSPGYYKVMFEVRAGEGDKFYGKLQRGSSYAPMQIWGPEDDGYKTVYGHPGTRSVCGIRIAELDADGSGSVNMGSDGMLIIRYMAGFGGTTLTDGAVDYSECSLCDVTDIENYLQYNIQELIYDIDGNGSVNMGSDGMLIIRYMSGFRGTTLTNEVVDLDNCERCDAFEIESYINSLY